MAITFETIALPGATPVANNSASAQSFANNYAKLKAPGVSTRERKAFIVLALMWILGETESPDYRGNNAGVIQDAAVYTKGISHFDPWAAMCAIFLSQAYTIKGSFPMTMDGLVSDSRDFINLSEDELDRIVTLLSAQLML